MKLTVASSPHIRGNFRTNRIMLDVILALLLPLAVGSAFQGPRALAVAAVSMAAAMGAEWLWCLLSRSRNTVVDGSAAVTGLLLAMTLPVTVPFWLVIAGDIFAIVVIKGLSGGLGQNIFNPALAARALMMLLFPAAMVRYPGLDGVTAATPLHHMVMPALPEETLGQMFLGRCPGTIGEVSTLALLIGGVYLLWRKVISVRTPAAYLGTVAVLTLVFSKTGDSVSWMLYSLCSGGVVLGAIFMATDYATSPATPMGQVIFGMGCGILTVLLRYFGLYPEGVTYAILIMNSLVWFIDRHTALRRFGTGKGVAAK